DREAFVAGAQRHVGATREQANEVFNAVKGFQGFGFAESHAWAFALHAYASGWLRVHYPAEYLAAILTEEPGMWSPSTKRQEARAWGVPVLPLAITARGVSQEVAREALLERLRHGPYRDVDDAYQRLPLGRDQFELLVRAGAFDTLNGRREALYRVGALANSQQSGQLGLFSAVPQAPELPDMTLQEQYVWDFQTTRFSTLEIHAIDFVRDQLRELDCVPLARLRRTARKTQVRAGGL